MIGVLRGRDLVVATTISDPTDGGSRECWSTQDSTIIPQGETAWPASRGSSSTFLTYRAKCDCDSPESPPSSRYSTHPTPGGSRYEKITYAALRFSRIGPAGAARRHRRRAESAWRGQVSQRASVDRRGESEGAPVFGRRALRSAHSRDWWLVWPSQWRCNGPLGSGSARKRVWPKE